MHNLVAFFESVTNGATLENLNPVTDALVTVTANGRIQLPMDMRLGAVQVLSPNITRARINTPSFRLIALPEIFPTSASGTQEANPPVMWTGWDRLIVPRNDEVGIEISRAGADAQNSFAGLWLSDRFVPAPGGPVTVLRATASVTLTVGTWVQANLTFDQTLPFGRYAVIGMHVECNDCVFARLTFPGNIQYRPGVPALDVATGYVNPQGFRMGAFGLFGEFNSTAQPGAEFLGMAAGAETPVVLLDIIKIG